MREMTNLGWPDTPYGADKRPVAKAVHLVTGMAMQWAADGQDAVPVSAAAAFLPIHRTRLAAVHADTLHFGFRIAVAGHGRDDSAGMLRFVDRILVQGRRHAAALAWHSYADDLHSMRTLARERLPGVMSVGEAWMDRTRRERGTAPLVDTAEDLGDCAGPIADAAHRHGIDLGARLRALQRPDAVQRLHEDLTDDPTRPDAAARALGTAALTQALAVALLAGQATDRLAWTAPLDLEDAIERATWHTLGPALDASP